LGLDRASRQWADPKEEPQQEEPEESQNDHYLMHLIDSPFFDDTLL